MVKIPNLRLQDRSPQTKGWHHGGYVHYLYTAYGVYMFPSGHWLSMLVPSQLGVLSVSG